MAEHPTKHELDEYCRRALAPVAFLSIHRHVTNCPPCAEQCNSPQYLERDLAHLREALISASDETPYHLSAAEMAAYVQGTLNEIDLEIAASHLGICTRCSSAIERHTTEDQPVAPVQVNAAVSRPSRGATLGLMNSWPPMRLAAAVLFGATLILLTLWLFLSNRAEHKDQTAGPASLSSPQNSSINEAQGSSTPALSPNDVAAPATPLPTRPDEVSDAQFALVLNDGGRKVIMDKRGRLAGLERLPVSIREKVGAALQAGRLKQSAALAHLASQPSTLLSEAGDGLPFRLVGPFGQVVRSQRPILRWRALPGAQSYKVIVTDADLNEVSNSLLLLNTTEWQITKPLPPGRIYSWQVTALKDGVAITSPRLPAPQARFKVIDRSTSRMLQQAERAYPDSHLALGVLYAEAGLLNEAEQQLRLLVRNNPQVTIAHKLLENVRAMRAAQTSSSDRF